MAKVKPAGNKFEAAWREASTLIPASVLFNDGRIPGRPDLAWPGLRLAVFLNGCFWHDHACRGGRLPRRNREFWRKKFAYNAWRQRRNLGRLRRAGWSAKVVWECRAADPFPTLWRLFVRRFVAVSREASACPA
jgi:DNA mismatch endonuclease (patch repair protein)